MLGGGGGAGAGPAAVVPQYGGAAAEMASATSASLLLARDAPDAPSCASGLPGEDSEGGGCVGAGGRPVTLSSSGGGGNDGAMAVCDADASPASRASDVAAGQPATSFRRGGVLSFQQGLAVSLNYNLSMSLLVFPYFVARSGWFGFVSLLGAVAITWLTASFIAKITLEFPRVNTYSGMTVKAASVLCNGSRRAIRVVCVCTRVLQLVELFMFLVFTEMTIVQALLKLTPSLAVPAAVLIGALATLPMILFTLSPKALSCIGMVGIAAFGSVFALLLVTSTRQLVHSAAAGTVGQLGLFPGAEEGVRSLVGAYGGILLIFSGHTLYPSIFNDLRDKSDMLRVISWTYAFMVVVCVVLATLVIFGYGPERVEALPTGYLEVGSAASEAGQVLMILKMLAQYPPISYPIVQEVSDAIHARRLARLKAAAAKKAGQLVLREPAVDEFEDDVPGASSSMRVAVGLATLFFVVLCSSFAPSLAFILSLTGAIFSVTLALTIPSLSFIIVIPHGKMEREKKLAWACIVFGVITSVLVLWAIFSAS
jgi:hypothetical protein